MMNLVDQAAAVRTKRDFVKFVSALQDDLVQNPEAWENASLDRFLDALGAWIGDMDGWFLNRGEPVPEQPDWSMVASMLMAARTYE